MNICGKGNLPECQFFTTGGCVSPFNCIYKIKQDFHTGATSNATEISRNAEISLLCAENTEIARLTAENAELRARLDKAIELPRIIHPNPVEWHIQYQYESGIITDDIRFSEAEAEARLKELQ